MRRYKFWRLRPEYLVDWSILELARTLCMRCTPARKSWKLVHILENGHRWRRIIELYKRHLYLHGVGALTLWMRSCFSPSRFCSDYTLQDLIPLQPTATLFPRQEIIAPLLIRMVISLPFFSSYCAVFHSCTFIAVFLDCAESPTNSWIETNYRFA